MKSRAKANETIITIGGWPEDAPHPSSLSDVLQYLPKIQYAALHQSHRKSVPSWAVPAEVHALHLLHLNISSPVVQVCGVLCSRILAECNVPQQFADGEVFSVAKPGGEGPDFKRFLNLLDPAAKILLPVWMTEFLHNRHEFFQFGVAGRGIHDALYIWNVVWERLGRGKWCIAFQFWDISKAFDLMERSQMRLDVTDSI